MPEYTMEIKLVETSTCLYTFKARGDKSARTKAEEIVQRLNNGAEWDEFKSRDDTIHFPFGEKEYTLEDLS